ncbi:hypothetical protein G3M48_003008 [Beauveria asiatica]|uniref:FAD-binding domain-containing protein n=1 Tax=Beauveria asiatica TaxID=1069075 RepID=A0AAW0RW57_9HYPO
MEIIIVGAGIAGLSLALSLARRPGHRVLLLEAKPALAELGAGLQLTPPATRHLFAWGMRDDILAASIAPAEMLVRDGRSGAALAAIPTGGMEARYGAPYLVVHRAVLHDLLRRHAVAAGAELRLGSKVVRYDWAAGAVELHDGSRLAADLVIGADGINSFARRQLLGDANASARPTGLAAVRAMAEVAEIKADPQLASVVDLETYSSHLWIAPGRSVMAYLIKEAKLFNVVLSHPDDTDMSQFTPDEYRAFAQDLVKDFEPRVRRLVEIALPTMQNFPIHAVPPLPRWTSPSGRFLLVGDAAHAMSFYLSMGVSLAVEDAASLTAVLDLACPPPPATTTTTTINYDKLQKALGVFEHARKERVHIVQDASLHGGHVLHEEDPATREKVYAALRADGLQDEGVSEATLATESPTYGLADQRVRDWCFAYDPAKYIKECYESMA